jgi:uncharacterized glyoxalase superfamily protein PhnB
MPLAETFFSPRFDLVADRFGATWILRSVKLLESAKSG